MTGDGRTEGGSVASVVAPVKADERRTSVSVEDMKGPFHRRTSRRKTNFICVSCDIKKKSLEVPPLHLSSSLIFNSGVALPPPSVFFFF